MKLLITGAGGQLGKEWVHFCENNDIGFLALGSKELDITDKKELQKKIDKFEPDVLINCAAYTKVDQAEDEPELALKINTEAVKAMSEICSQEGIKLVHYSTDYVFSGHKNDKNTFPEGYPEDGITNPINTYGKSKRQGEVAIVQSGCDHLILRVSWLCGTYGNNFVKTMLRIAEERDELNVVNDQFGSPTFADQVVEQTYQLLLEDEKGIFNISSAGITTWYEFAKEIFSQKKMNTKVTPVSSVEFKTKAIRPQFSKLDTQKISTIPGINIVKWQDGLRQLLNTL